MSKLSLYGIDLSPPVRACLLTLKALEVPFEYVEVNLSGGEHHSAAYLKKNPLGTVPLLEDDGNHIADSHAICSYLVDKYGTCDGLYPKDLLQRAVVNHRMYFDASIIYMSLWNVSSAFFRRGVTAVPKEKTDNIHSAMAQTEQLLADQPYIAGATLTIADFCCAATVTSLAAIVDIPPEKYPKLTAWLARLAQLPYFEEANGPGVTKYIKLLRSSLKTEEV